MPMDMELDTIMHRRATADKRWALAWGEPESGSRSAPDRASESGQASVLLLSILGTFLLASVAFAVDMGSLWFHRQTAQTAADAACGAGAMDMLYLSQGKNLPGMGFTPGTGGQCSAGTGGAICSYAGFNGYTASGGGLNTTTVSSDVIYSFPGANSVTGVTGSSSVTYPLLKVIVEENVRTWFMGLVGKKYQVVAASSTCGMSGSSPPPPPLVVLSPTGAGTLNINNHGSVIIQGGPTLGVEVNSSDPSAVAFANGSDKLDTSLGGPGANFQGSGSNVGVFGNQLDPGNANFKRGSGQWIPNSPRAVDPFAAVTGPNPAMMPTSPTSGGGLDAPNGTDGCLDTNGCKEFKPGVYAGGINYPSYYQTMIFLPGVYYMNGTIYVNVAIRMAHLGSTTVKTDGVMFYFKSGTLEIGGYGNGGNTVSSTTLTCDGSDPDPTHGTIPANLSGSVLVGACTANGTFAPAYGGTPDTAGTASAPGKRGIIVFHDPSNSYTPCPGSPATCGNLGHGSTLVFAGSLYYHSTNFQTLFNVSNAGTSGGLALGQVIADKVNVQGSGALQMLLLPNSSGSTKAGVFQ